MKRPLPILLLLLATLGIILVGCSTAQPQPAAPATAAPAAPAKTSAPAAPAAATTAPTAAPAAATAAPAAAATLKVGVSPVPHGDILKYVRDNLAARENLKLDIVEFTDYVQPNLALGDKQIDANYFQHTPYMEDFGKQHNLQLVAVTGVHIEPLGIYSKKVKGLDQVPNGSTVAIPNDATNGGRALQLLAANKLITLKQGVGTAATVKDVVENPKQLQIKELEAAQLPRSLDDTSLSVINGNYALQVGLKPAKDALALEKPAGNPYVNVLTVLKGRENDPNIQKLAKLLTSPEVKKFIQDKYEGSVVPAF